LIELLIVVAVIAVLISILIPAMGKIHERARAAQTTATLAALQSGLERYFNDFNMYPPSNIDSTPTYGGLTRNRGSVMVAQGLVGYLDSVSNGDGAGPSYGDPAYGFRTRKVPTAMGGGTIYGPYVAPDAKTLKAVGVDQYFVDGWSEQITTGGTSYWNHEILYFRSTRAPGADPVKLQAVGPTAVPGNIFGTGTITSSNDYYFDTSDCAAEKDDAKGQSIPSPTAKTTTAGFFAQLGATDNTTFTNVLGAKSFLLISAGPDGKYFTNDDIILSK
jgi:type II secretory pathway pseudopilin PulG